MAKEPKDVREQFIDDVEKLLSKFEIKDVLVITDNPKIPHFYRGHMYDVAKMVAAVYRKFRSQIISDIEITE